MYIVYLKTSCFSLRFSNLVFFIKFTGTLEQKVYTNLAKQNNRSLNWLKVITSDTELYDSWARKSKKPETRVKNIYKKI